MQPSDRPSCDLFHPLCGFFHPLLTPSSRNSQMEPRFSAALLLPLRRRSVRRSWGGRLTDANLDRKLGEAILIGDNIRLVAYHIGGSRVRLGIAAPKGVSIVRGELLANAEILALDAELKTFLERTVHVCGTARRRVLQGEQVPNSEKLFSIFEPHTQLYKRGKAAQPIQFGRQVLIYEDGAGFVADAYLLPRDADDRDVVVRRTRILQRRQKGRIRQASFDRGFHSPENQRQLARIIAHPCLPMPGTHQAQRQAREASIEFRQARQRHPGIESAIGALQAGNGLTRCRDRTEPGFARYIQLAMLGRNLHALGKILIASESATCQAARSGRKKAAA